MMFVRRVSVGAVAGALLLQPAAAFAAGQEEPKPTVDTVTEKIHEDAREAGLSDGDSALQQELTLELPDEDGTTEPETVTLEEAILRVGDRSLIDTDEHSGFAGLPWGGVGNVTHAYVDYHFDARTAPRTDPHEAPDAEDFRHYDVVESDWVPDTPIVPVINPLLLAGAVVPDLPELPEGAEVPLELPPLLVTHWGGPLTSVQGSGWEQGFHSAGTTPIGSNVDTQDRTDDEDALMPFWVPLVEDGELLIADEEIDFAGWAMVTQDAQCERVTVDIPFTQSMLVTDICVSFGLLLGNGVVVYDGEGPMDLRSDGALLWEPAPEPIGQVIDGVSELVGQLPTEELLGQVLEVLGDDSLGDIVDDSAPDEGDLDPETDVDAASTGSDSEGLLGRVLGGLGR